jgi:hypothetical protein
MWHIIMFWGSEKDIVSASVVAMGALLLASMFHYINAVHIPCDMFSGKVSCFMGHRMSGLESPIRLFTSIIIILLQGHFHQCGLSYVKILSHFSLPAELAWMCSLSVNSLFIFLDTSFPPRAWSAQYLFIVSLKFWYSEDNRNIHSCYISSTKPSLIWSTFLVQFLSIMFSQKA